MNRYIYNNEYKFIQPKRESFVKRNVITPDRENNKNIRKKMNINMNLSNNNNNFNNNNLNGNYNKIISIN